jgi:3-oxoacyl-ACP reductase-like protein
MLPSKLFAIKKCRYDTTNKMSNLVDMSQLYSVKDKVALVTGGGTGIGKMIAFALVANGAKGTSKLK